MELPWVRLDFAKTRFVWVRYSFRTTSFLRLKSACRQVLCETWTGGKWFIGLGLKLID